MPPTTKQDRLAVYTCFMPVRDVSQEDLIRKKEAFESMSSRPSFRGACADEIERLGTTHWPNAKHVAPNNDAMRDGKLCPKNRSGPVEDPVLNERTFKLTGIPYIKASA